MGIELIMNGLNYKWMKNMKSMNILLDMWCEIAKIMIKNMHKWVWLIKCVEVKIMELNDWHIEILVNNYKMGGCCLCYLRLFYLTNTSLGC
jgi:hypothetical protein